MTQTLEHEVFVHHVDYPRILRDQVNISTRGDNLRIAFRALPSSGLRFPRPGQYIHKIRRIRSSPQWICLSRRTVSESLFGKFRRVLKKRTGKRVDPGRDRTAQIFALPINGIDRRRRSEVADDTGRAHTSRRAADAATSLSIPRVDGVIFDPEVQSRRNDRQKSVSTPIADLQEFGKNSVHFRQDRRNDHCHQKPYRKNASRRACSTSTRATALPVTRFDGRHYRCRSRAA